MTVIRQWLWRVGPGNPMVVRIVEGGSQRAVHLWVRMGYLGALIGLVLLGLLFAGGTGGGLVGEASLTALAKSGARIFQIVAYGQVILVCLLAPLFMAGAIGQERAGETLDILLTTPLSNLQIVLGSLMGRLFFVLALLFSGLPLFAILLIFGGVPISSVFLAFAVAGFTALLVGAVAIALSVLRAGGRKAVFVFVISIAAYLVGAYVFDVGVLRRLGGHPHMTTWLTPLHPLLVLEASLASANYQPPGPELVAGDVWPLRFYLGQPFAAFCTITTTLSLLLLIASAVMLRGIGQGESNAGQWLKRKLRMRGVTGGTVERRRPPRVVGHNPIAWREAHTRGKVAGGIIARGAFSVVGICLGLVLLIAYHLHTLPTVRDAYGRPLPGTDVFRQSLLALLLLEVAVIVLVAIYMSAGCVSREREDGTLDLVLTTPVTPKQYIWGKLRGLVRFLTLLIAVPVVTLGLVSVYTMVGHARGWPQAMATTTILTTSGSGTGRFPLLLPEAPLLLAVMLVPFVGLCVAAGMNWSLKARGVLGAVVPSAAILGALILVLGLCGWNAAANIPLLGPILNAFSPATNLTMLINPWEHIRGFADDPGYNRVWLGVAALIAAGGYSFIVWTLIVGMVKGFDQTVRRLSGAG